MGIVLCKSRKRKRRTGIESASYPCIFELENNCKTSPMTDARYAGSSKEAWSCILDHFDTLSNHCRNHLQSNHNMCVEMAHSRGCDIDGFYVKGNKGLGKPRDVHKEPGKEMYSIRSGLASCLSTYQIMLPIRCKYLFDLPTIGGFTREKTKEPTKRPMVIKVKNTIHELQNISHFIHLTIDTFGDIVNGENPVLVYFYSPTCSQCRLFSPHFIQAFSDEKYQTMILYGQIKIAIFKCASVRATNFGRTKGLKFFPYVVLYYGSPGNFGCRPSQQPAGLIEEGGWNPEKDYDTMVWVQDRPTTAQSIVTWLDARLV